MVFDRPPLEGRTTVSVIPVNVVDENIADRLEDFGVAITLIKTLSWSGHPDLVRVVGAEFAFVVIDTKLEKVAMILLSKTTEDSAILSEIGAAGGVGHIHFLILNYQSIISRNQ